MRSLRLATQSPDRAEALEAGRVGGHHAIELHALPGLLDDAVRVEELVFLRDAILVPADHLLAFVARAPSVRPSCEPTQSPSGRIWPTTQIVWLSRRASMMRSMILGCGFMRRRQSQPGQRAARPANLSALLIYSSASGGRVFSSSSMMPSTRLPRTTESSIRNRSRGVYFKTTARAHQALDALAMAHAGEQTPASAGPRCPGC